jgi:hypothetical protein
MYLQIKENNRRKIVKREPAFIRLLQSKGLIKGRSSITNDRLRNGHYAKYKWHKIDGDYYYEVPIDFL